MAGGSEPTRRRLPPAVGGSATLVAGAVAWCLPFWARLARVPSSWWIARDDGIITLSHARNLADHGSIGVSPGGDRVEGYSSPLHFTVAGVVELFADPSAVGLSTGLFVAALFGTGVVLTYGSVRWWRHRRPDRRVAVAAVVSVGGLAVVVSVPWTTTGWLGSGMENPFVVFAMACVISGAIGSPTRRSDLALLTAGSTLLMIARVEFAAFAIPVVAAIAVLLADGTSRLWGAHRRLLLVTGIPLGIVAAVHGARRLYFGAWLPNTAIVQSRDAGMVQFAAIAAIGVTFVVLLVRHRALQIVEPDQRGVVSRLGIIAMMTCGLGLAWFDATGRFTEPLSSVLVIPGVLEFTAVVVVGLGVTGLVTGRPLPSYHWVFAALALLPLSQYLVTGAARLDDNRVSGLAVPVLVVWAAVVLADLASSVLSERKLPEPAWARRSLAVVGVLALLAVGSTLRADGARSLDYEISWAEEFATAAETFGSQRLAETALPITANPDLGKLSFEKESVIVDLGWLGDPLLATLRATDPELMSPYLRDVAVPDLVNIGGGWSCEYRAWLESSRFVAEYTLLGAPGTDWVREAGTCPLDGRRGTWVRAVDHGEFGLTIVVATSDEPTLVVREALGTCAASDGGPLRCQHVRRAVWRASQTLRDRGTYRDVIEEFAASPSASFDRLALERGPAWWEAAAVEVTALLNSDDRR